jgi:hypothetical protein
MEGERMMIPTMEELKKLQEQLYWQFGTKVDVHHSEKHRGIIVVPHGSPLNPFNVLATYSY